MDGLELSDKEPVLYSLHIVYIQRIRERVVSFLGQGVGVCVCVCVLKHIIDSIGFTPARVVHVCM